jgi:hypothetical protein
MFKNFLIFFFCSIFVIGIMGVFGALLIGDIFFGVCSVIAIICSYAGIIYNVES